MKIRIVMFSVVIALLIQVDTQTHEEAQPTMLSIAAKNPDDPSGQVTVSLESFNSNDPYDIIRSNISFVNNLFRGYLKQDEVPYDALKSYYVDYYLAQVNNGGLSQFAYNSRMTLQVREVIKAALESIGAVQHLELFKEFEALFDSLSEKQKSEFFEGEYFGDKKLRDKLNTLNDKFNELNKSEDLLRLNSDWLKSLPNLLKLPREQLAAEAERRVAALIDKIEMAKRKQEALDAEPRYMKLIRALCAQANLEYNYITAGAPIELEGENVLAWHFFADKHHYYFADFGNRAAIYDYKTNEKVSEIAVNQ